MSYRVSKEAFEDLVQAALAELPDPLAELIEEIQLEIADWPTSDQMRQVKLQPPALLLGLYQGRPRTGRSVSDSAVMPDRIWIFQEPIQRVCRSDDDLRLQVRKTVLHEIGHHFGMSEADLASIGYG